MTGPLSPVGLLDVDDVVLFVIRSIRLITWELVPSVSRIATVPVPAEALGSMWMGNWDEALPPDGMLSGFGSKVETLTPDGTVVVVSLTCPA